MIDRTTMPASTTCETSATFMAPLTTVGAISEMSAPPSDRPMMQMTVPATSGGKKRMIIEKGLARSSPSAPEDDHRTVHVGQALHAAVLDDDHRVQQ